MEHWPEIGQFFFLYKITHDMCSLEKKMQKWLGWRNLLQKSLMKNLIFELVQLNGVCEETLFV